MLRRRSGGPTGDVVAAVAGTVACSMPVFLVGELAVQLRSSLHFGAGVLGVVVAIYYFGAGVSSIPFGRLAERVGGLRTMRLAAAASAVLLLLVATSTRSWPVLAALMLPAGMASAAMQPGANVFLAKRIAPERQGLAFGFKQAAVPFATVLGGLAVPGLALTVGWRFAFVAAMVWAAVTAALLPRPSQSLAERRAARATTPPVAVERGPLVVLAVGMGLGIGTASALAAFVVSSAVDAGLGRGEAGLLAAFGGVVAVVSRILVGHRADRRGRAHLPVVASMLAVGALGYVALAFETGSRVSILAYLPVVAVVFGAGWGWNGLFNFAVVRSFSDRPGLATGVTQAGGRVGGMLGPLLFGVVVAHGSYELAWILAAVATVLAAAVVLLGRRLLLAQRGSLVAPSDPRPAVGFRRGIPGRRAAPTDGAPLSR